MTTSPAERPPGSVDPKLLEILVCPLTKGPLEYDAEKQELISRSAKLAYPIRRGAPAGLTPFYPVSSFLLIIIRAGE
jgi:uncharacterized protein YbaR (Trm112 family)